MKFSISSILSILLLPLALAAPNPAEGGKPGEHGSVTRVPTSKVFNHHGGAEYHGPPAGVSENAPALLKRQWEQGWGDCDKGVSLLCYKVTGDMCIEAFSRFSPDQVYTSYTARVGYNENKNFGLGAGCIAKYECSQGYPPGMTGGNIYYEFYNHVYFGGANCRKCGTWRWPNGCTFTLDYCFDCVENN